jgi:hypothetical protein
MACFSRSILLMRQDLFPTSAELPNLFFSIFIFRTLMSRHWWQSRLFLLVFQKKIGFNEKADIKIDSTASSGGQGART